MQPSRVQQLLASLYPIFAAAEKSASGINWGVVIGIVSMALSIIVTVIVALVKKKSRAEEELRKAEIKSLEKDIKATQETCARIEGSLNEMQAELRTHSDGCGAKFVLKDVYKEVLRAQREDVNGIRQMVTRQADIIEKMR